MKQGSTNNIPLAGATQGQGVAVIVARMLLLLLFLPAPAIGEGIVINAVGDIMLGSSGAVVLGRLGYGYPFAATGAALKNADLTVGNLEAPITRNGTEYTSKRFRFKSDPKTAAALKESGFSVMTLANNHMLDYGPEGMDETILHLTRAGIAYAGAGKDLAAARRPALVTVKGKKVAFLAYSLTMPGEFFATASRAGTAPGYLRYVREDIARVRPLADHVIVSFHWGAELAVMPRLYQTSTARAAIDAGADVIIGHHPHVLQGIERYRGGIILYSLGNFAFATQSMKSDRSVIARITLEKGVKEVEILPINVLNREVRLQPALLYGTRGKRVIDNLNSISFGMGTTIVNDGGRYFVDLGQPSRMAANLEPAAGNR